MNNKFKKILSTVGASVLAITMLAGCSTTTETEESVSSATAKPVSENLIAQIKISGYKYEADSTNLTEYIKKFNSTYQGVEVSVERDDVSAKDYFDGIDQFIESDTAGDVVLLDAERMAKYAQEGKLINLSEYLEDGLLNYETYEEIDPSNDLLPAAYESCLYNGQLYMVGTEYYHKFVFLNYDLLEKSGYSFPKDDWTWDDLIEMAEKIKEDGTETPIAMDYTDYDVWGAFARSYGKDIYDSVSENYTEKELNLTHPDVVSGITDLADLVNPERGLVACVDSKDISAEDLSKYAFVIADHEDISVWAEYLCGDDCSISSWDYIHFPRWNDADYENNNTYYQSIGANVYGFAVINHGESDTYNDEFYKACAYLALYATVESAATAYSSTGESVPANSAANTQKFWREFPEAGKNSSVFSNFAETADYSGSLSSFMPVTSAAEIDISYAIDGYLSGERTVVESLQTLQEAAITSWVYGD